MKRLGAIVLACAALALAGCTSSAKSGDTPGTNGTKSVNAGDKDAASQVKITSCKKDPVLGLLTVKGTATNTTSKRSDFAIDLAITSADGKTQLGTTIALASNVEPGQTALWDAPSTVEAPPGAVCKVSTVSRTASI